MKIDIRKGCMYIELNEWIYYIDDSTNEQIIKKWKKGTEEEQCLQYYNQRLMNISTNLNTINT